MRQTRVVSSRDPSVPLLSSTNQARGGLNNWKGNRYENLFATAVLLSEVGHLLEGRLDVTMQEQASCPVDDLVVRRTAGQTTDARYYQLKDHQSITWGLDDGKLRGDFQAQSDQCVAATESYALHVVVPHESRRLSLETNLPNSLTESTSVVLFPNVLSARALSGRLDLIGSQLSAVRAHRDRSPTGDEAIVIAVASAWANQTSALDGPVHVSALFEQARSHSAALFKSEWDSARVPDWNEAERLLETVHGLSWTTARGYFEWWYPPTSWGIIDAPCGSERVCRIASRIVASPPSSFEEFEALL